MTAEKKHEAACYMVYSMKEWEPQSSKSLWRQDITHHKLTTLAAVGFEPTPPKRLEPKSSALDHSATLPQVYMMVYLFVVRR